MNKYILGLLATTALAIPSLVMPASAADLPTRRAPPVYVPPPIPLFSWTGFYVGGQVGAAFGNDRGTIDTTGFGLPAPLSGRFPFGGSTIGTIGGAHIGYNLALPGAGLGGSFVVGVEGDVEGTDYRGTSVSPAFAVGGVAFPAGLASNSIRQQIAGSVRGRLGIAVDRALFYATGGVAFTQFQSRYSANLAAFGGAGNIGLGDFTHTRTGFTIGAGMEYAITTQFSLRGEYRYTDYGTFVDPVGVGLIAGFGGVPVFHKEVQHRLEVGFSYKFDSAPAAPVVARY